MTTNRNRNRNRLRRTWVWLLLLIINSSLAWAQDYWDANGGATYAKGLAYAGTMQEQTGPEQLDRAQTRAIRASMAAEIESGKETKDLTGFFAIGFIINMLVIGAFLYWAIGQWRKRR